MAAKGVVHTLDHVVREDGGMYEYVEWPNGLLIDVQEEIGENQDWLSVKLFLDHKFVCQIHIPGRDKEEVK